jgi:hypothetical protein
MAQRGVDFEQPHRMPDASKLAAAAVHACVAQHLFPQFGLTANEQSLN